MSEIFSEYSDYYDLLYDDKPYREEAGFIAGLMERCAGPAPSPLRILDLACGTGRHAVELAARGFEVEGSDPSPGMIARAGRAARERGLPITFHPHSFQSCREIGRSYDAILSLFSAIGYLTDHRELVTSLRNIHSLLDPGGLFIFDYWNGNAVLAEYSPVKVLRKSGEGRELIRISRTALDRVQQVATVDFQFICLAGGVKQHDFTERHPVRYFFFREMEAYLDLCGFDLRHRTRFMGEGCLPGDWNITVVAQKRS